MLFGKTNANGVGAVIENHRGGGRLTFQNRRGVDGDLLGSETRARRYCRIHLVGHCRAADGIFDAVEDVDHGVSFPADFYFVEGIGDARRCFIEELAVLGKKFDDDGLRSAGQIPDHVLEELNELDFGAGFGGFNFGADVGNDVVDVALAILLQPDGKISVVRLGDGGKAQLHTGAAGSVLDFRRGLKNFLNVQEDAVGFSERTAGRREVIENESAFVHGREEVRAEKVVTQEGKSDDQDGTCYQHPGPLQDGTHDAHVKLHDATKETRKMSFFRAKKSSRVRTGGIGRRSSGFLPADKIQAESGRPS